MKKLIFNEQDAFIVSQRYGPSTIVTLLQEVSQAADVKIDWNAFVEKTATGITNAREYQMLWRHLAYHHPLLDKIEEGAEPLDDDSDLEIELEIVPPVIEEVLCQAIECVQSLTDAGVDQPLADGFNVLASECGEKVERSELEPGNKETTDEVLDVKAPIVGGVEPGLDEAAEGVVGGEQRLVGRKRRLGDG